MNPLGRKLIANEFVFCEEFNGLIAINEKIETGYLKVSELQQRILVRIQVCYMRKFSFEGNPLSIPTIKSDSGVV